MWKIKEWFLHYKEAIRVSLLALFRWTLLAVCTGVLCGGIGTLFHLAVEWVTEQRTEHVWLLWLLPAAGIAITALYKATGCVGKGTNDVLRAVQDGSSVTPWLVPAIFLGTVLTHLCGGSAGREGAALQMGGSIGWNIGRVLHFNNHDCHWLPCAAWRHFFGAVRYAADRDPVCDDGGGCGPDADRGVRAGLSGGAYCIQHLAEGRHCAHTVCDGSAAAGCPDGCAHRRAGHVLRGGGGDFLPDAALF